MSNTRSRPKRKKSAAEDDERESDPELPETFAELIAEIRDIKQIVRNCESNINLLRQENQEQSKVISHLRSEVNKLSNAKDVNVKHQNKIKSYADTLNSSCEPDIVIQPKKNDQNSDTTINDIKKNISPSKICIDKLRKAANGAIIVKCANKESSELFQNCAKEKLCDNYDVKVPDVKNPQIKIINVTEKLSEEEIIKKIKKQNDFVPEKAELKVKKTIEHTNKDGRMHYTVIIEVDQVTYQQIITHDKLSIGWDRCRIFEHIFIMRCYQCLGFNHSSKVCTKKQACFRCGGEHERKSCTSDQIKCVNCSFAVSTLGLNIDAGHEAYSPDCAVLQKRIERQREQIYTRKDK